MVNAQELQRRIAEAAADAAEATAGVAYLQPGLGDLVRGRTLPQPRRTAGVRVRRRTGPDGWELELDLAVRRGHRVLDVARAARAEVGDAVRAVLGPRAAPMSVTVTVTDIA